MLCSSLTDLEAWKHLAAMISYRTRSSVETCLVLVSTELCSTCSEPRKFMILISRIERNKIFSVPRLLSCNQIKVNVHFSRKGNIPEWPMELLIPWHEMLVKSNHLDDYLNHSGLGCLFSIFVTVMYSLQTQLYHF